MVLFCLGLVLQYLLANVFSALVKVIMHAIGPGDRTLLFAVKLLQERGDYMWVRILLEGLRPCLDQPTFTSTS
jgi:hypothetical protein